MAMEKINQKKKQGVSPGISVGGGQGRPTIGKRGKREKGHGAKQRGTK